MVELYKFDCNGNLYFCDYGLISKTEDYKLRGYVVRRAVPLHQRRAMPQRGRIDVVHRTRKVGLVERFVNDCKHNVQVFKEIGGMVKDLFAIKTKRTRRADAAAYFAGKLVSAVA
jgi:hypothetical protein